MEQTKCRVCNNEFDTINVEREQGNDVADAECCSSKCYASIPESELDHETMNKNMKERARRVIKEMDDFKSMSIYEKLGKSESNLSVLFSPSKHWYLPSSFEELTKEDVCLFAAAPEMLKSLKEIYKLFEIRLEAEPQINKNLLLAIAKAEGRET